MGAAESPIVHPGLAVRKEFLEFSKGRSQFISDSELPSPSDLSPEEIAQKWKEIEEGNW